MFNRQILVILRRSEKQIFYFLVKDALQVMYTPERGRFVVADRDIDVGECIIHEEAIVNKAKFQCSLSHCYNCQKDTRITPIPCDTCAGVVFCSDDCKSRSELR